MGKLERTRRMDDKVGTFREAMKAVEAGVLTCYVGRDDRGRDVLAAAKKIRSGR